jgi:hypothetical protein
MTPMQQSKKLSIWAMQVANCNDETVAWSLGNQLSERAKVCSSKEVQSS